MTATEFDYDLSATVVMLAALQDCPEAKRIDTLAVVTKLFVEGRWPVAVRSKP